MKIVCAWCQEEGLNTVLGEREPISDTTETHGICGRHSEKLLEQLPSGSFPGIRILFVVRVTETGVYDHLTRSFAGLSDVAVITDRRKGERRRAVNDALIERRRANRRLRQVQFSSLGYLVVRFGPERETGFGREPAGKLRTWR